MKIRIMSDLHIDVNMYYPFYTSNEDKDIFTILAGDTAGDLKIGITWVKDNCPNGVCVAGNHIVYNNYRKTVSELKDILKKEFPKNGSMVYLENDYIEIPNENIIIVGATLYTDFKLYGINQKSGMEISERNLNDYRLGYVYDDKLGEKRKLKAEDYLNYFTKSKEYIRKVAEENPDKQIIVVSHHGPSPQCIDPKYSNDNLNSSYASDLEYFIKEHSNIKCWICGHSHSPKQFKIGQCLVIQNPRGYCKYNEDINWTPNVYLDTNDWSVTVKPFKNIDWDKQREKDDEMFEKILKMGFF